MEREKPAAADVGTVQEASEEQASVELSAEEQQSKTRTDLLESISEKELRKLRARERHNGSVWFGLGTFGMIGWSVAVPALLGVAVGIWLDERWPATFSWTLTMLFLGFALGCLNAWYWVTRERQQIHRAVEEDSAHE